MKKNQREVSWTSIDSALWGMREKCRLLHQEGIRDAYDVFYAVQRYINTARASTEWIRLFINLDGRQVERLIKYALNGKDTSVDGMMAIINKHIKVEQAA